MRESPLGQPTEYSDEYAPGVLFAVPRAVARDILGLGTELPFTGADVWNAWELTWLNSDGKPVIATATLIVDATSPNVIESKSLKLYLNSFAMTRYVSADAVATLMTADLSRTAGADVAVDIVTTADASVSPISNFAGACIDDLDMTVVPDEVDALLLRCESGEIVSEALHSHLLRSNCPVTSQPDMGSLLVRYCGPKIDRSSLLRYIVSYRQHNDFHEACVERIFVDIKNRCAPDTLTVYARYNRRGGLDINPFRTDTDQAPENSRLWRQ